MASRIVLPDTKPADDNEACVKLQQDLLVWAEELFGKRDASWCILPPIFGRKNPHIFYPDPPSSKLVRIKLGCGARDKWTFVLFQLAHEVIHLLNPLHPEQGKASCLEEGVACAFSAFVQQRCGITGDDFVRDNLPSYLHALCLVRRLPQGDIAAAKRIRRELPAGTSFSKVTTRDLKRIFSGLDCKHANALTSKFCRNKTEFP